MQANESREVSHFDYIAQAHVTASSSFYGQRIPFEHMKKVLGDAICALNELDKVKKALFYGKPLGVPATEDNCEGITLWLDGTDEQRKNILHGIIGAATETGELLELLYATVIDGKPFDSVNLDEETGDVFWYFALLAKACGFTFEDAQRKNIAKLRMRYGEKFSEFDALNRNLIAERSVLEANFAKQEIEESTPRFSNNVPIF